MMNFLNLNLWWTFSCTNRIQTIQTVSQIPLSLFFTIRLVNWRHYESFCWSVWGVRSGSAGVWYVLPLIMFSQSIRWVFVLFCSIILAKKFSLSLKALQLNVTNVRTTRAHALKFETATMMMPACPSTREVSAHSYLKK